jgi:hypothetical protein
MAIINKTGITDGGTIQAAHVTRSIDALSGGSTDTVIASGSFTGSFTGTLLGTASFATTASYAVNAAGAAEYMTLTFFHSMKTNTTSGSINYIGGVPTAPYPTANRIGIFAPFTGVIVSGSATSYTTTQGAADVKVSIAKNGTVVGQVAAGLDLTSFVDKAVSNSAIDVLLGDLINIQLRESATTSAVYGINVVLQLKKS